jgi:putative hydrolase of the HAD superfamily
MLLSPFNKTPDAIFFDLDGTLRHDRPSPNHFFFDRAVSLGALDSPERRRNAQRWAHFYWGNSELLQGDRAQFGRENLFWENYARRHLEAFGCSPGEAAELAPQVHAYMADEFRPENWVPQDVFKTLEVLKEAGLLLGVVSNRIESCEEELDELGLLPYFSFNLVAGQVNSWKPAPEIFYHALERGPAVPADTLYIGDNYYADVVGARAAGLHPVLIDPGNVFPEADCPVIHELSGLLGLISLNGKQAG